MNSYEILKRLSAILERAAISLDDRTVVQAAINHIQHQDREIQELREDITNTDFTDES